MRFMIAYCEHIKIQINAKNVLPKKVDSNSKNKSLYKRPQMKAITHGNQNSAIKRYNPICSGIHFAVLVAMTSTAQRNMLGILTILLSVIIQRVQPILQPQMPIQGGVGGGGMINGGFFNHHQQGFMQPGMQPGFMQPGMQPGGFLPPGIPPYCFVQPQLPPMMQPPPSQGKYYLIGVVFRTID